MQNKGTIKKENGELMDFSDLLLYMDNGQLLIARVVSDRETPDAFVHLFQPAEVFVDEAGINIAPWIPESSDTLFNVPAIKVTTFCTPRDDLLEAYQENFIDPNVTKAPTAKQDIADQKEQKKVSVKKKKQVMH